MILSVIFFLFCGSVGKNCKKFSSNTTRCGIIRGCGINASNHSICSECKEYDFIEHDTEFTCQYKSDNGKKVVAKNTCAGMGRYMKKNIQIYSEYIKEICVKSGCFYGKYGCTFEITAFVIIMLILLFVIIMAIVIVVCWFKHKRKPAGGTSMHTQGQNANPGTPQQQLPGAYPMGVWQQPVVPQQPQFSGAPFAEGSSQQLHVQPQLQYAPQQQFAPQQQIYAGPPQLQQFPPQYYAPQSGPLVSMSDI